jgi:hypothetical protein
VLRCENKKIPKKNTSLKILLKELPLLMDYNYGSNARGLGNMIQVH